MELKVSNMAQTLNFVDFEFNNQKYAINKSDLIKAFEELKIWYESWNRTNFSQKLIELICKADDYNKIKIAKSYPEFICAYYCWYYKEFMGKKYTIDDPEMIDYVFFDEVLKNLKGEKDAN